MVPEFYYEDFSRQPRFWKKECTGGTGLTTKMKMTGKNHKRRDKSFQNNFLNIVPQMLFGIFKGYRKCLPA